ncbi:hypothetical protein H2248_001474 [Termitomyces sp. 'cryptogamus']|nr:hypothetical protein H2248_001474 [Termitomyces sp. 'cryptogamus']
MSPPQEGMVGPLTNINTFGHPIFRTGLSISNASGPYENATTQVPDTDNRDYGGGSPTSALEGNEGIQDHNGFEMGNIDNFNGSFLDGLEQESSRNVENRRRTPNSRSTKTPKQPSGLELSTCEDTE